MKTDLTVEQPIGGGGSSASASSGFLPVEATAEKVRVSPRWSNTEIWVRLRDRGKHDYNGYFASETSQGQRDAFRHDFGFEGAWSHSNPDWLYSVLWNVPIELFQLGFIVDGDK